MKKTSLFGILLVCMLSINSYAQFYPCSQTLGKYNVIDTCKYKIYYALKINITDDGKKHIINDIQRLEIGKKCMKCYSYLIYKKDSLGTEMLKRGANAIPQIQEYVFPSEIILNSQSKITKLTYRTMVSLLRYTEPTEEIKWNITNETDTVLTYNCQKATCQFRGRTYNAWFAIDIPFNYGPYKFYGLPGLILKIRDAENEYCWDAVGIEKAKPKETIKEYKWAYMDVTREKVNTSDKMIHQAPFKFYESMGMRFRVKNANGSYGNRVGDDTPIPYSPLEK